MHINKKKALEALRQHGVQGLKNAPMPVKIMAMKQELGHTQQLSIIQLHKTAEKLHKDGKPVTVDTLLIGKDEFRKLARSLGLEENWFEEQAEIECEKWRHDGQE